MRAPGFFQYYDRRLTREQIDQILTDTYCEAEALVIRATSEVDDQTTENQTRNKCDCTGRSKKPAEQDEREREHTFDEGEDKLG